MKAQGMRRQSSVAARRVVSSASLTPHAVNLFTRGNRWKAKWATHRSLSGRDGEEKHLSALPAIELRFLRHDISY